jgi:hypothetical protein
MSIEHQALSGLKWMGAARFLSQTASWAVTVIVVKLLPPSDYGLVAVSSGILSRSSRPPQSWASARRSFTPRHSIGRLSPESLNSRLCLI